MVVEQIEIAQPGEDFQGKVQNEVQVEAPVIIEEQTPVIIEAQDEENVNQEEKVHEKGPQKELIDSMTVIEGFKELGELEGVEIPGDIENVKCEGHTRVKTAVRRRLSFGDEKIRCSDRLKARKLL